MAGGNDGSSTIGAGFETGLRDWLSVTNLFWSAAGTNGDDTHGHIDDNCRFVNSKTVVLIKDDNPADVNYRPLAENGTGVSTASLTKCSQNEIINI